MPSFPHFSITQQQIKEINAISQIKEEILKVPTFQSDIPQWDFTDIVCEMLYQFADMVSNIFQIFPEFEDFVLSPTSSNNFLRSCVTLPCHSLQI